MCFTKKPDKWTEFKPSPAYFRAVEGLTTVAKLHLFIQCFQWTGESGKDVWQTPEEFLRNFELDCDDFMRFCCDVLKRIMGIEAVGIIQSGYNKALWGDVCHHHAITVFPFENKLAVFSNDEFYVGLDSYEDAGKILFVDGLKYQEVRNWKGKILSKRNQRIGTF